MNRQNSKQILFMVFYNKLKAGLYNYVFKMVGDKDAAGDIVQAVFMKFFENIERIKEESKIPIWIFKTARNEVYTFYRQKKKTAGNIKIDSYENYEISSKENIQKKIELKEFKEIVLDQLNKFTEINRETFLLREFGELSYKEIAFITGVEVNIVKSRLFKTRKKLVELTASLV